VRGAVRRLVPVHTRPPPPRAVSIAATTPGGSWPALEARSFERTLERPEEHRLWRARERDESTVERRGSSIRSTKGLRWTTVGAADLLTAEPRSCASPALRTQRSSALARSSPLNARPLAAADWESVIRMVGESPRILAPTHRLWLPHSRAGSARALLTPGHISIARPDEQEVLIAPAQHFATG